MADVRQKILLGDFDEKDCVQLCEVSQRKLMFRNFRTLALKRSIMLQYCNLLNQ